MYLRAWLSPSLSSSYNPPLRVVWPPPPLQALTAQDDLEKAKEELKTAVTVMPAAPGGNAENDHDEQDENHAEASAELSNEGVSQVDLRSEEARVTEAQKNERVKQQLQVRGRKTRSGAKGPTRGLMGPKVESNLHYFLSVYRTNIHEVMLISSINDIDNGNYFKS